MSTVVAIVSAHGDAPLSELEREQYTLYARLGEQLRQLTEETPCFVARTTGRLQRSLHRLTWTDERSYSAALSSERPPKCKPQLMWRLLDTAVCCISNRMLVNKAGDECDIMQLVTGEVDETAADRKALDVTDSVEKFVGRYESWVKTSAAALLQNERLLQFQGKHEIRSARRRALRQLAGIRKQVA